MKTALVIADDYWHRIETIEPLIPLMLPDSEWQTTLTRDPAELLNTTPDLFVTFKDPIENDQVPTPIWCDDEWSGVLTQKVSAGMGFLAVHCGLTDLPREHVISRELFGAVFVTHPPQCPVRFISEGQHEITAGVTEFMFPEIDEHYVIEMLDGSSAQVLAYTESEHGRQPALWVNDFGAGRVCCVTPGHSTPNLICAPYLHLLKNAVKWTCGK